MASDLIITEYGLLSSDLHSEELEQLCEPKVGVQTGPFGSQLHKKDYVEVGTPIITVEHLGENRIRHTDTPYVSDHDKDRLSKYSLKDGDIVFSRVGSVDRRSLVRKAENGWLFSGRCLRVRVDKNKIDPSFLSYFFGYEGFKNYIKGIAVGATMPSINTKILSEIRIFYPSLTEQKAIAHILGSLDDKIELNRQMNETLKAMAQALFKSWFVDFDPVIDNALAAGNAIPDEFIERAELRKGINKKDHSDIQNLFPDEFEFTEEMGWIPRGWVVGKYSDLAELNPQSWNKKSIPKKILYVDLGNTNNGKIDLVVSYSSSEAPSRAKRVLSIDDTIVGTVRPGNRSFAFIHNKGLTGSTGFAVMKPKEFINRTYIYLGLTQDIVIDYFAHIADGGAYPAINPSVVADLECITPPSRVLEKFDDLAYPLIKKIGENNNYSEILAKLRDTLLPKLMSGELRLDEVEILNEL